MSISQPHNPFCFQIMDLYNLYNYIKAYKYVIKPPKKAICLPSL